MTDSDPFSPEQQQQLADAKEKAKKILAASRVAAFNGWTVGTFAVISLLFAFFSFTSLIMGIGLGWVARNELRGKERIRAFDPAAATLLGRNQLGLLSLIAAYALVSIYRTLTEPIPHLAEIEEAFGPIGDFVTSATVSVYVGVIVLTLIYQGLNARYYFARKQMIDEYLLETPNWVVDLQRPVGRK